MAADGLFISHGSLNNNKSGFHPVSQLYDLSIQSRCPIKFNDTMGMVIQIRPCPFKSPPASYNPGIVPHGQLDHLPVLVKKKRIKILHLAGLLPIRNLGKSSDINFRKGFMNMISCLPCPLQALKKGSGCPNDWHHAHRCNLFRQWHKDGQGWTCQSDPP